jgi:AcrR family transcriptional regulator
MARSARRPAAETREHVVAVASDLFYWRGIRGTGVDLVAAEAGIAPTTLYRLFASKDDLVAAYVERAAGLYRERFLKVLDGAESSPQARILAVFDALIIETQPQLCRGCPFQLVLAETPEPSSSARQGAVELKVWVHDQFRRLTAELAAEVPIGEPEVLADDLMLVMEGVYGLIGSKAEQRPAVHARSLAERLLKAAAAP